MDKHYLRDLEEKGVKVIPNVWLEKGTKVDVKKLVSEKQWRRVFLKPIIGQSSRETLRFDATEEGYKQAQKHLDRLLPNEGMIMQPYLHMVEKIGEFSGIFFNYKLANSIQKVPVYGDYKVQDDWGAIDRAAELDQEALALCFKALSAVPFEDAILYARVDIIRDNEGQWALTELEIIEPSLFFRHKPESALKLADAVEDVLQGRLTKKPANLKYRPPPVSLLHRLMSLTKYFLYVLMTPMCLGLAYRLYWSKGDFSSDEYQFVFATQSILTVITWLSHYRATQGNPGIVKPWHFREEGKLYWVDGKVG
jgi:hypothetical protein